MRERTRRRGRVRQLPSGSFQVTVYAGDDPLTGKRIDISETIPAGPDAAAQAERARVRLLNQVDEKRNPRTSATVNQLMDRYLEVIDVDRSHRQAQHVFVGSRQQQQVADQVLNAEVLGEHVLGELRRRESFRVRERDLRVLPDRSDG